MKKFIDLFLDAVSFLTVLPVKRNSQYFGYKMFIFFPLVGFLIGYICYSFFIFLRKIFNLEISTLLTLSFYIFFSDFLHLDGFVDTVDATFGKIKKCYIEILKDPHIGVVGSIYLFIILLVKYLLFLNNNKLVFVLTPVFSKTGLVFVGFFGKKLKDGIGEKFLHRNLFILFFCLILSLLLFILIIKNVYISLIFVCTSFLFTVVLTYFFNFKFGGINGDVFGFINETLEILFLILFLGAKI